MGEVNIEFRCPAMSKEDRDIIIKFIITYIVKKYNTKVVHIRSGIHPNTYASNKKLKADPDKNHITGEFFHPKDKCWYNFHLYVAFVQQTKDGVKASLWILNPYIDPNPRIYFDKPSYEEDGKAEALKMDDIKETIYY